MAERNNDQKQKQKDNGKLYFPLYICSVKRLLR